jgi:hypothetical protein
MTENAKAKSEKKARTEDRLVPGAREGRGEGGGTRAGRGEAGG